MARFGAKIQKVCAYVPNQILRHLYNMYTLHNLHLEPPQSSCFSTVTLMNNFQLPELSQFAVGLMHIQLLHTSASLAINENWDPDVRDDMEMMLNRIVPEDVPFRHSCEGPDDMVSIKKKT